MSESKIKFQKDVPDPVVKVRLAGESVEIEEWIDWHISQNLTDRWGEINDYAADKKPLGGLKGDAALLERLRAQMWGELTFIARKDGQFGVLFESEYLSQESEEIWKDRDPDWYATLKPHAKVVRYLLDSMMSLSQQFPGVLFAVPSETETYNGRPTAWAFVPDALLTEAQRGTLGSALLNL